MHAVALPFLLGLTPVGVAGDVLWHPAGQPENLDKALPTSQVQGKWNNGVHCSSGPGFFPQLPHSSHGSLTFSMWPPALACSKELITQNLFRLRSIGSQVTLRKICSKYRCTIDVSLWRGWAKSTYTAILDLLLELIFVIANKFFLYQVLGTTAYICKKLIRVRGIVQTQMQYPKVTTLCQA